MSQRTFPGYSHNVCSRFSNLATTTSCSSARQLQLHQLQWQISYLVRNLLVALRFTRFLESLARTTFYPNPFILNKLRWSSRTFPALRLKARISPWRYLANNSPLRKPVAANYTAPSKLRSPARVAFPTITAALSQNCCSSLTAIIGLA